MKRINRDGQDEQDKGKAKTDSCSYDFCFYSDFSFYPIYPVHPVKFFSSFILSF
jgi:hypothetical protein